MIEAVSADTLEQVLPLLRRYQQFYGVADINDQRNRAFFGQFGADCPWGCLFAFRSGAEVLGFATVYNSFSSTLAARVSVLNDLYTTDSARGQGVGRALIEHARDYARSQGSVRLQWLTASDNSTAQALYDNLETNSSDWRFYTYPA